jgi:hypothetical protein
MQATHGGQAEERRCSSRPGCAGAAPTTRRTPAAKLSPPDWERPAGGAFCHLSPVYSVKLNLWMVTSLYVSPGLSSVEG